MNSRVDFSVMSYPFGFLVDSEKIIYVFGFKLILKRIHIDILLYRVNAVASAFATDGNIKRSAPPKDPSRGNRIIIQKDQNEGII